MGKVVKFTGSKLLGEELRRLRGERSLEDVVEMGRSKLLQYGFRSVAKTSLSEIENGKTLPNIESVFALSILYQIPTSRFLHLLLEESLTENAPTFDSAEALHAAFAAAVHEQRPSDALSLASQALRQATPGWDTLRWRLNRATAIERLGMRGDALAELQDHVDSPDLPAAEQYRLHKELARLHASAGQFSLAEMHLDRALAKAPAALPLEARVGLLRARVRLVVSRLEWGLPVSELELDQADDQITEAFRLADPAPSSSTLMLTHMRACIAARRGDVRTARHLMTQVLGQARELRLPDRQIEALCALARLDVARDPGAARKGLAAAAELAVDNSHVDHAFLAFFELSELAESPEQRAHFLRKCRRIYPLVQSSHPSVKRFEKVTRGEAPR